MDGLPIVFGGQRLLQVLDEHLAGDGMGNGDAKVFVRPELGGADHPQNDRVNLEKFGFFVEMKKIRSFMVLKGLFLFIWAKKSEFFYD